MSGRGRGFILQKLLSERASDVGTSESPTDSGFLAGEPTTTDSSSKLQTSFSSPEPVAPKGRAKLVASLITRPSIETSQDSNVDSASTASSYEVPVVRARGRGALLKILSQGLPQSRSLRSSEEPLLKPKNGHLASQTSDEAPSDSVDEVADSLNASSISVEREPITRRGDKGTTIQAAVNYIRLTTDPDKGVFEYEVRIKPTVASKNIRYKLLNQHRNVIGEARTFDGVTLYLPIKLRDRVTSLESVDNAGGKYVVEVIFKKQKKFSVSILI